MTTWLRVSVVCLALTSAAVWAPTAAVGQAPDRPDFSGFWTHPMPPGARGGATVFDLDQMAPFQPEGEALFYEPRTGDPFLDEPRAFCFPSGFPSGMLAPYPVQIVQSEGWLVMVHEFQRMTRLIPLDGRAHRDVEPTYYGDSVGHWENDALVIETLNFKRWSLDDFYYQDPTKYRMHSEDLRTVERLRFLDPQTISYELTIDDPQIFTEAWTQGFLMRARTEWSEVGLFEFVCQENNRCPGGNCGP
jgi:hypothetical protein